MHCTDPEEHRINEYKMKKMLENLSKNLIAQQSSLRLEVAPTITNNLDKDKGKVFDVSYVEAVNDQIMNASMAGQSGLHQNGKMTRESGIVSKDQMVNED